MLLTRGLLGAHVVGGAYAEACLGEATPRGSTYGQGNPEIRDQRTTTTEQDVRGFDVPVDYARVVCGLQGVGDFACDSDRFLHGELPFAFQFVP